MREAEDEVDVRGEVELVPAELSHAHHEHGLRVPVLVLRGPELCTEPPVEPVARRDDGLLGNRRKLAEVLLHVGSARKLAPGDRHHLPAPEDAERLVEGVIIGGLRDLLKPPVILV